MTLASQGEPPEFLRKCPDNLLDIWFRALFERGKVTLKNIQPSSFFCSGILLFLGFWHLPPHLTYSVCIIERGALAYLQFLHPCIICTTAPKPSLSRKKTIPSLCGCSPWLEMISLLRPRSDPEIQSTENWRAGRQGCGLWGMCGALPLAVGLSLADILAIQ